MDSSAVLSSRNAELDAELAEERERIQEILESASAALERQREEAQMQRAAYDQVPDLWSIWSQKAYLAPGIR